MGNSTSVGGERIGATAMEDEGGVKLIEDGEGGGRVARGGKEGCGDSTAL
jgi:hypothetical protein